MDKIDLNCSVRQYLSEEQDISLLAYLTRPDIMIRLMNLDPSLLRIKLLESSDSDLRAIWSSLHPNIPLEPTEDNPYNRTFNLKPSTPLTPVEYLALVINRRIKGLQGRMEALQELPGNNAVKYQDIVSRVQENRRMLEIIELHLQTGE